MDNEQEWITLGQPEKRASQVLRFSFCIWAVIMWMCSLCENYWNRITIICALFLARPPHIATWAMESPNLSCPFSWGKSGDLALQDVSIMFSEWRLRYKRTPSKVQVPFKTLRLHLCQQSFAKASHIREAGIKVWGRILHSWGEGHAMSQVKGMNIRRAIIWAST